MMHLKNADYVAKNLYKKMLLYKFNMQMYNFWGKMSLQLQICSKLATYALRLGNYAVKKANYALHAMYLKSKLCKMICDPGNHIILGCLFIRYVRFASILSASFNQSAPPGVE